MYISKVNYILILAMLISTRGYSQENVDFQEMEINCLYLANTSQNKFIVNNAKEMDEILKLRVSIPHINCLKIPRIDFINKTLVGYVVSVGSCTKPTFQMNFTKEDDHYYIKVEVTTTGICRMGFGETYWMLIDKVEDPSLFHFKTEFLRSD